MRRALLAAVGVAVCLAVVISACMGEEGVPASPGPVVPPSVAASTSGDAGDAGPPRAAVTLGARVQDLTDASPIPNVLVVVEVGGLNQPNPAGVGADGGVVEIAAWNPFFQYAAVTDDVGAIKLSIPGGLVGLHAFGTGYLEGLGGPLDAGPDAGSIPLRFLADADTQSPVVSGLTAYPVVAAPGQGVTFTVLVTKPMVGSLSDEVILVEPVVTHQAFGLAPPTPVVLSGPFPAGIYSRIVPAPQSPGVYTYDVVAASFGNRVASNRVSVVLTVTADGGPIVDAATFPDTGGLPDGRH